MLPRPPIAPAGAGDRFELFAGHVPVPEKPNDEAKLSSKDVKTVTS
jgi:hypothetical protein